MEEKINQSIEEGVHIISNIRDVSNDISKAGLMMKECLAKGNKILIMGNGGSASQASHVAGEIVGRFKKERKGMPCIALTTDISVITAIGNDYGFEKIFERQVEALAKEGDILIGLSTSGNSENVVLGLNKGRELGCKLITLTGNDGGKMKDVDINININSSNTPRVQEAHIMILHMLCEIIEA
ncbi:SIS domain-containing protein [Nanoarchaeota archaeon]